MDHWLNKRWENSLSYCKMILLTTKTIEKLCINWHSLVSGSEKEWKIANEKHNYEIIDFFWLCTTWNRHITKQEINFGDFLFVA